MNRKEFIPFSHFEKKFNKDPELRQLHESLESEFQLVEEFIKARRRKKLTQKQLALKLGTKQSAIARIETKEYNPSLKQLKKLATALDSKLVITLIPIEK